jgi:anti-sigma B factor antagonist
MDRHAELFNCTVETRADWAIVRPFGELDCWNVPFVEQHLLDVRDAGMGHVELDLDGLSFLDSSAVAMVVRWSRTSAQHGFLLRVRAGSPRVRRIFEITSITHLLTDEVPPEQFV